MHFIGTQHGLEHAPPMCYDVFDVTVPTNRVYVSITPLSTAALGEAAAAFLRPGLRSWYAVTREQYAAYFPDAAAVQAACELRCSAYVPPLLWSAQLNESMGRVGEGEGGVDVVFVPWSREVALVLARGCVDRAASDWQFPPPAVVNGSVRIAPAAFPFFFGRQACVPFKHDAVAAACTSVMADMGRAVDVT